MKMKGELKPTLKEIAGRLDWLSQVVHEIYHHRGITYKSCFDAECEQNKFMVNRAVDPSADREGGQP
jgi:hypothetical protein